VVNANGRPVQLVAWLVLLGAFAAFVAGMVGVPALALRWWRDATVSEPAVVACKTGSCALGVRGAVPVALRMENGDAVVPEGTSFATDGRSKGFVQLFDGSTVNLEPNTTVVLDRMRRSRFSADDSGRLSVLRVASPVRGETSRLSVGTTWGDGEVVVQTDHGVVRVGPEARARLELDAARLLLTVAEGLVYVEGTGRSAAVRADTLVESTARDGPGEPRTSLRNVLADSDFDRPLADTAWRVRVDLPFEGSDVVRPYAVVETVDGDRTRAVRIVREDSDSRPADLILEQFLDDRDVSGAMQLGVRARLRVLGQSLPLGGTRGSEFPVILKLVGETEGGEQPDWRVGFYAVLPPADEPLGKYVARATDVEVPLGDWFVFESGNLLDPECEYGFARFNWSARPARLKRFEIIASGHDYAAEVDLVELWVK